MSMNVGLGWSGIGEGGWEDDFHRLFRRIVSWDLNLRRRLIERGVAVTQGMINVE